MANVVPNDTSNFTLDTCIQKLTFPNLPIFQEI